MVAIECRRTKDVVKYIFCRPTNIKSYILSKPHTVNGVRLFLFCGEFMGVGFSLSRVASPSMRVCLCQGCYGST